jgi:hypothetical protein
LTKIISGEKILQHMVEGLAVYVRSGLPCDRKRK